MMILYLCVNKHTYDKKLQAQNLKAPLTMPHPLVNAVMCPLPVYHAQEYMIYEKQFKCS